MTPATSASPVSLEPLGARSTSVGSASSSSLSSRVGTHKDYRIYRSTPLSEPLRGLPPMARPVDASYYAPPHKPKPRASLPPPSSTTSTSSSSTTSSTSSRSSYYRQRSDSFEAMLHRPSARVRFSGTSSDRNSFLGGASSSSASDSIDPETPFDAHLLAVYAGTSDTSDGVAFFESHGYYDVDDANTVEMFRSNFGLTDVFWDKTARNSAREPVLLVVPSSDDAITSRGATLHRTLSGRFELVNDDDDDDLDAFDDPAKDDAAQQKARALRVRTKALELDDDDLKDLAHDQAVLVQAICAIRTETQQFRQYFTQAFADDDAQWSAYHSHMASSSAANLRPSMSLPPNVLPASNTAPLPSVAVALPPYCGNVFLLKDTIPYLLRSWRKRWFYLDFTAGVVLMYKRSYWKSPRGMLDLRDVVQIEKMTASDFRIELLTSGGLKTLMMRTKQGEEAALWVNLLRFAKVQCCTGGQSVPQLVQDAAAIDMRSAQRLERKQQVQPQPSSGSTTQRHAHSFGPFHLSSRRRNGFSKGPHQTEVLAMLLSQSATPAPPMSTTSNASDASSVSSTFTASSLYSVTPRGHGNATQAPTSNNSCSSSSSRWRNNVSSA